MSGYGTYQYIYVVSGFLDTRTGGPWHFISIAARNMSPAFLTTIVGMELRKRLSTLLRFTLTNKVGVRTYAKRVQDIVNFSGREALKAQPEKSEDKE